MRRSIFPFAVTCAMLVFGAVANLHSAVGVSFSGGNGSPLTLTLEDPISFTVTAPMVAGGGPIFVLKGAGDISVGDFATTVGGTITFSVNGGPAFSINAIDSGLQLNDHALDDISFFGSSSLTGASAGDVIVLSAGQLTTFAPIAAAAPTTTSAESFIVNWGELRRHSTDGVTVPEPSTCGLIGLAVGGLAFFRRRRKEAHL